jgi:hypothetical protein
MDDDQTEAARIALEAAADFGFVLAGGNAIAVHGIGSRPSEDIDLFTNRAEPDAFASALTAIVAALREDGWAVQVESSWATFARISATRGGRTVNVDLGVDYRSHPPAMLTIGPVLTLHDAAASKVATLYSRGLPRDFLDVAALIDSDRFSHAKLVTMGDEVETSPMDREVLGERFRSIDEISDDDFAAYGVSNDAIAGMRSMFRHWADIITDRA